MTTKLLIATTNKGKVKELSELLAGLDIELLTPADYHLEAPEETGRTFSDNALLKARYYGAKIGLSVIADDSGLVIDALGGAPGVDSALWAENGDFTPAMLRVERELAALGKKSSPARFECVLVLRSSLGQEQLFLGHLGGTVDFPMRGASGFGYDPIFTPEGHTITLAEMSSAQKNAISHRGMAFAQLKKALLCLI